MIMEATTNYKPKTMAELLAGFSGIQPKDSLQSLTSKKKTRPTMVTRTEVKVMKPMTREEMAAAFLEVTGPTLRRNPQNAASTKKKNWNSSVKVDKTISHMANGNLKYNPVRKVLNFKPRQTYQPKPVKPISNLRATMAAPESPKFTKPEFRPKKSVILQARNNIRISGICNMPETPVNNKPMRSYNTLSNKENITNQFSFKKSLAPKPVVVKKKLLVPDTPLSNDSWRSNCDASFLQKEKEINDIDDKIKEISEEPTLENLAKVSPSVSTPFKQYRSVQDFFDNSNKSEDSALYNDNTITMFDKPTDANIIKREESVIVSLCDLLKKTSVTNSTEMSTELKDLLELEQITEQHIKMIENHITSLNKMKESHFKSLQAVRKLINEKKEPASANKTLTETKELPEVVTTEHLSPEPRNEENSKPCSVIKSRSPSYKIPKKNLCLRKKVICKSMPNVSNDMLTPVKSDMGNRALSMYMKMKEHMNFLTTPVSKHHMLVADTPAVTSHNLQKQLDSLYGENEMS